jgi:hypothetical protein
MAYVRLRTLLESGRHPGTSVFSDLPPPPPRNNVVKRASAPAKRTFASAEVQNPQRISRSVSSDKEPVTEIGTSHRAASSRGKRTRVPHPEGEPKVARRTEALRSKAGNNPHYWTQPPGLVTGRQQKPPNRTTVAAGGMSTRAS